MKIYIIILNKQFWYTRCLCIRKFLYLKVRLPQNKQNVVDK